LGAYAQDTPDFTAAPVVSPLKESLDAPDAVNMLKIQRDQYVAVAEVERLKAEMESKRAEMNAAFGRLQLWDRVALELLQNLRVRYNCPSCNIDGDMKWMVPPIQKREGVVNVKPNE
jgi:hypothetical protein